jgi:uncharacterized membrane protein YtjA (UPF0391 family)
MRRNIAPARVCGEVIGVRQGTTDAKPSYDKHLTRTQEFVMFGWAIMFLLIALVAAALGFGGVAGTAMSAAQIVFVVALIAFVISAVMGYRRRGI